MPNVVERAARSSTRALGRRAGFAVVAYAFTVTMLGTTLPTPLYPVYSSQLHLSQFMVTVVYATYAAGVIAALLLFGRLSDETGRRRVLLGGMALSTLSAVVFLNAHGTGLLLVGRVLSGLSAGIFTGTATAALADLAPPTARGRASLVATMANMLGLGCGPLLAGVLAEFVVWPLRLPFWAHLGLLVPAVALVWMMPEPGLPEGRFRIRPQRLYVPAQARAAFVRAALAGFAGFGVLGLFTAVSPAFIGQVLGIGSLAVVGLVVFAVFAASVTGQLVLVPVFGSRALLAGCVGLIVGMGLFALGLALSSLSALVTGGVVAGLGQGLSFRPGLAAVNEASPAEYRGGVASSFFVVVYVAISVPIVADGLIAELAGVRTAGLALAALVGVLAATVLVLLARRSPLGERRGGTDTGRARGT